MSLPTRAPLNTGCPQHKVSRQSRAGVQRPREADKASRGQAWTRTRLLSQGIFFKELFVPCPWTWRWLWLVLWGPPPGGPGDPYICCLPQDGSTGEPEKGWARSPTEEKRRPADKLEQKGCRCPQGPCHPATATPSARGKGKGPERGAQHGSGAQPRYLVGPGVVHREGQGAGVRGAASVERAVG